MFPVLGGEVVRVRVLIRNYLHLPLYIYGDFPTGSRVDDHADVCADTFKVLNVQGAWAIALYLDSLHLSYTWRFRNVRMKTAQTTTCTNFAELGSDSKQFALT